MDQYLELLAKYLAVLTAFGGAIWTVFQFLTVRAREAKAREFEVFHRLIMELVEPVKDGVKYLDRQCAIVFELRFFPRYYPLVRRTLDGLKTLWSADTGIKRLLEEFDRTQLEITRRENLLRCRVARRFHLAPPLER